MSECPGIVCDCNAATGVPGPFEPPHEESVTTFYNIRKCATATCPESEESATACVESGLFTGATQAAADAAALAQATLNAQALLSCVFTSSQEACIDCPTGTVGLPLIPVMTSATAPSGVASASSENVVSVISAGHAWQAFNQYLEGNTPGGQGISWGSLALPAWLRYEFTIAQIITSYSLWTGTTAGQPKSWTFQGSNDGTNWDTLDIQINVTGWNTVADIANFRNFPISSPASYLYYRINVSTTGDTRNVIIYEMQMYSTAGSTQICKSATATSLVSQADADALAYAAALQEALEQCSGSGSSNNINDASIVMPAAAWNQAFYAAAAPYPSIINIPTSATIASLRVQLHGVAVSPNGNSWQIILRGPDGTSVVLWSDRNASMISSVWSAPVDISFDDTGAATIYAGPTELVSGIYKPSSGGLPPVLTVPAPGPQGPFSYALSAFSGKDQQGGWSLWVCSRLQYEVQIVDGWELNITTL